MVWDNLVLHDFSNASTSLHHVEVVQRCQQMVFMLHWKKTYLLVMKEELAFAGIGDPFADSAKVFF